MSSCLNRRGWYSDSKLIYTFRYNWRVGNNISYLSIVFFEENTSFLCQHVLFSCHIQNSVVVVRIENCCRQPKQCDPWVDFSLALHKRIFCVFFFFMRLGIVVLVLWKYLDIERIGSWWYHWRNHGRGKWETAHFILDFAHWDSVCWDSFIYEVDDSCSFCLFRSHLHSRLSRSYSYFV